MDVGNPEAKTTLKRLAINLCMSVLFCVLVSAPVFAAQTANVLAGGICLNEILPDPDGTSAQTDTDGNGIADDGDEFVELFNLSATDIDISGWQLWDAGAGNWFTFPSGTILHAGAYAVVVVGVQVGGTLPLMTNPESIIFDAARSTGVLTNGGDNVVLYAPGEDAYVHIFYNGDPPDDPPVDYTGQGFSATASRMGSVEDFGTDSEGKSLARYPSGDTNVIVHDAIPGVTATASPTNVSITHFAVKSRSIANIGAMMLVSLAVGWAWSLRQTKCIL